MRNGQIFTRVYRACFCLVLSLVAAAASAQEPETHNTSAPPADTTPTPVPSPKPPPFTVVPQDQDWSMMRDPALRSDWSDKIKYIPLGQREDWYLSIGGEARPMYERYRNEDWGSEPEDLNGYWLQRFLLYGDFHFGKQVRFFGQLESGFEAGRTGPPRPVDKDPLDVLQAFLDLKWGLGKDNTLTLRAGRQEMDYGSGRLVSIRDGTTLRQSFDGGKLMLRSNSWSVDGFVVKPVRTDQGFFDDKPDSAQTFWGAYATHQLQIALPIKNLELYYLGLARRTANFDQGSARELRHTIGTRLAYGGESWDYNAEFIYQFGSFGNGKLRAWAIGFETAYYLPLPLRPRPGFKANVTSGDDDPDNPDLGTFHPLFPKGAYFGQLASIGPLNHRDLHPTLEFNLPHRVLVTADWVIYWRQSLRDGVYSVPGNLLRTGRLSRARFIGHQPGVGIDWFADRHTTFSVEFGRFLVGPFLRETPPGENTTYFAAWMTYRF